MARRRNLTAAQVEGYVDPTGALGTGITGAKPGTIGGTGVNKPSSGFSAWGGLKTLGSTALNTLSVPQAAVFTGLGKLQGRDISWKNAGGYFYGNYKGSRNTLGVDNKWLALGLDIAADPTWILALTPVAGQGYAAAKLAKTAGTASRFSKGARAVVGPFRASTIEHAQKAANHLVTAEKLGKEFAEAFAGSVKDGRVDPTRLLKAFDLQGQAVGESLNAANQGYRLGLRLGTRNFNVEVPLWHRTIRAGKAWNKRSNALALSKLQHKAFQVLNAGENVAATEEKAIARVFKTFLDGDTAKTDRALVGLALLARGKSAPAADQLINTFREAGFWAAGHDEVYRGAVDELGRQAQVAGKVSASEQAKVFKSAGQEIAARISGLDKRLTAEARRKERSGRTAMRREVRKLEKRAETLEQRIARLTEKHKAFGILTDLPKDAAKRERALKTWRDRSAAMRELDKIRSVHLPEAAKLAAMREALELPTASASKGEVAKLASDFLGELRNNFAQLGVKWDDVSKHPDLAPLVEKLSKPGRSTPDDIQAIAAKLEELDFVRPITTQTSELSRQHIKDSLAAIKKAGEATPIGKVGSELSDTRSVFDDFYSPVESMGVASLDKYLDDLGIPEELVPDIVRFFNNEFALRTDPMDAVPWATGRGYGLDLPLKPELDAYTMISEGNKAAWDSAVRETIETMIVNNAMHQPDIIAKMGDDVRAAVEVLPANVAEKVDDLFRAYHQGVDSEIGWLGRKVIPGRDLNIGQVIAWTKAWFTIMNPAHYFRNAWGSFVNGLIRGDWGHLKGLRASIPGNVGNPYWKLGRQMDDVDPEYWNQVRNINGIDYTNGDLMAMANMSGLGLGHGQTKQEIEIMIHLLDSKGGNPLKRYARRMQKANITRENADRIQHWLTRVRNGEDPLTAGAHTIRSYFDYNALTAFEKVWLRNLIFFYTWMRKNTEYQLTSMLARPGAYAAMYDIEQARRQQADPNEPEWIGKTFGVWFPGLKGGINFGNPMTDVHKFDLTQEDIRRNYLGATNPFIQAPIQYLFNKSSFTGADIDKYQYGDQRVPSLLGYIPGLGGPTRQYAGAPLEPGVTPGWAFAFNTFKGPIGGNLEKFLRPRGANVETERTYDILNAAFGLDYQEPEPVKWARNEYYRRIRERADQTAAYNLSR